ncbi:glycoside hydrolase family 2 TIM barrel-domain containing protein [Maribellus sp. YY47]|uniref:glycoside hydrolase family 2 TIM barrel-domain containing protein n=1 Tax=Maribellus sp. YY47 TaxID=2929486 RepID=UPI0020011DCE|nr:glycoside hydrolase family 2 TIM barrel-domain containing protein [Maribellus sp. YY47]MCK3683710.1 DUF4982 domain-containing protein [Maribellus sp. YY47]
MKPIIYFFAIICLLSACATDQATRKVYTLDEGWKFINQDIENGQAAGLNTDDWETVRIPHDWAIKGPFDKEIDKQTVQIEQNQEKTATEKTGRTGALPYIGVGWYRNSFEVPELQKGNKVLLVFDGAMAEPQVFVNGNKVGEWKYGYAYFYFDITQFLHPGTENLLAVRLENQGESSRWYPGAGLYRKVQLIVKNDTSFKQWGTFITTPFVSEDHAQVNITSEIDGKDIKVVTEIRDEDGKMVASASSEQLFGNKTAQNLAVTQPKIWDTETPHLYYASMKLYSGSQLKDEQTIRFGIRDVKYERGKGLILNGKATKFKGVCLHHDLGPLGAAVNKAALKRQLTILKDMGCNAMRSSHNMPSLEQLELCDEMGFLFLAESFDEWKRPKVKNGYHRFFDEYAEKDVVNLVRATRNHPCIVMWSAGNEVPDQWGNEGIKRGKWLQDIFHREDPTRPVTVGMDQVANTLKNGFGAIWDIPGLNYRLPLYNEAYERFPQGFILGSETASTVSSRGVYKFPVEELKQKTYPDGQCSSYDLEACWWSNIPDEDFYWQDDFDWVIGEFVWTGFDYLGEPTPYDEYWPSRSSYFGICDLAGLPKDRYYLYRSRWNTKEPTLHVLPHWNWEGREGETIPVFAYTSYNSAELFVNGKSMGVQHKNKDSLLKRNRLMWRDVKYEPGTIKVVALDDSGKPALEKEIHTAGAPHHLVLEADRKEIAADGMDLSYVTVSIVDKDGNLCPNAGNPLHFKVSGAGKYKVACNGDATSLEMFHLPTMKAFNGKLVVTVQSLEEAGAITLEVTGENLETGTVELKSI